MKLRAAGEGPLVVKVAGLAGGIGLFAEEIEAARTAGFRVAALDTTGDRADDPAPGPLSWDGLAGELALAVDRLGERRALFWGTSFGTLVCLAAAARYPDRVAGLLLCTPPAPGWRPALHLALYRRLSDRPRPAEATARWFTLGFFMLNAWEFVIPSALSRLPGLAAAAKDASTPATTIHEKLALLFHDHPGLPAPERPIPCSIIAGAWDTVVPPHLARRLAAELPGSRLRLVPMAGHSLAFQRPRIYRRWTIEELRRLSGL